MTRNFERLRFDKEWNVRIAGQEKMGSIAATWTVHSTPIHDVEKGLEAPISNTIEDMIKKRKTPIRVLDIGCGEGVALNDLKQKFGRKIVTSGINLGGQASLKPNHFFKGDFRERFRNVRNKYDVIFSNMGPIIHHHENSGFIATASRVLAPGGVAFFNCYQQIPHSVVAFVQRRYGVGISVNQSKKSSLEYIITIAKPQPGGLRRTWAKLFGR